MMDKKQQQIFNGLKSIGEEIASFYADGVRLIADDNYLTKSYLIAHIAREIDGGLRDIFSKDDEKKKNQKEIKNEVLEEYGLDKDTKGHIASILTALNMPLDSEIARQWIRIATEFVNFAHRHGAYKNPRSADYIIKLWQEYESLLSTLIGNYLQLLDRLDRLILYKTPTEEIIETLPNLLISRSRFNYFFSNLKSTNWFVPLFNKGYFVESKNPEPQESETQPGYYFMPYWTILEYLKKVSNHNKTTYNKEITGILVSIIEDIINFRNEKEERVKNIHTDYSLVEIISLLPKERISQTHFDFINDLLNSYQDNSLIAGDIHEVFLKNTLEYKDKELTLQTLQLLLSYKDGEGYYETKSVIYNYWLNRSLVDYKVQFIEICGIDAYLISLSKIKEIVNINKHRFDISDIPTIEEHEQTFNSEKYECQVIYFIRDIILALSVVERQTIIEELFKEKHPIFHRLALYTIGIYYNDHSPLFWAWSDNPFNENESENYTHELYELLKHNVMEFTETELIILLHWIDNADYNLSHYKPEHIDIGIRHEAYKKREWLSSIIDSNYDEIIKKSEEYIAIYPDTIEHPGFSSWHESHDGTTSPLTGEEIQEMSLSNLIEYFDKYEKDNHSFIGPSIEGLTYEITSSIKSNPELYIMQIDLISKASIHFQSVWIYGLLSSWEDNHTFEVTKVLDTCLSTIQTKDFWRDYNSEGGRYENNFIHSLLRFIKAGIKDDKHSFEIESLDIIKVILFNILDYERREIKEWDDLSTTVLNSTKGMTYTVLMDYTLKHARLNSEPKDKWDFSIKEKINELIDLGISDKLFYFTLGSYITKLWNVSTPWVLEKIDKIFSLTNTENWAAAFTGYLYNSNVYKNNFELLQKNRNYNKALKYDFTGRTDFIITPLVNHICIALCYDLIDIEDELIVDLINSNNKDILKAVYYYFWNPRNEKKEITYKIKPLWKKIYEVFRAKPDDDSNKAFLGEISVWIKNIETIDSDVFEWLKYSSKYIKDTFNYLRSLNEHLEKTPELVANLLVSLFEINVESGLARDRLKSMIERLYILSFKDQADIICIKHSEQGINTLRDTYKKYN
jgi:hypothetical protein